MDLKLELQEREVQLLQEDWSKKVAADAKYWLENDAKKRAISSAKSYEEFSDIVKAAHLRPISRSELIELGRKKTNRNFSQMQRHEESSSNSTAREAVAADKLLEQVNSPAKFCDVWSKISSTEQLDLLRCTPLTTLDEYFQKELPPALLSDMAKFLSHDTDSDEWLHQLLKIVINSYRFEISRLFLSSEEIEFYKILIEKMSSPEKNIILLGFGF